MGREHWSDEQLIAHVYGVGPEDGHLSGCAECRSRLEPIEARAEDFLERASATDVPADFLAAQRRTIYARLGGNSGRFAVRRWAPALAAVALVAGIAMFEQQRGGMNTDRISDAELVQQASQLAEDSTPQAVAPIEALFGE